MNRKAAYYIDKLKLKKHPEGGYFCEVYRSGELIRPDFLPERYKKGRAFSTSIYFLLEGKQVSTFHRLRSDEVWHFYVGCTIIIYIIDEKGNISEIKLGKDLSKGEAFQYTIPKNCWFGAELSENTSFALVGCSVAPGFDFDDFEMGNRKKLTERYPQYSELIKKLTTPSE